MIMVPEPRAPDGWRPLASPHGFLETVGPFFWKSNGENPSSLCFRVTPTLCNPLGNCHGGMLATFCDFVLAVALREVMEGDIFLPTVNLTCNYLRPAPEGSLVISDSQILRIGKGSAVSRCVLVNQEERSLVSASASFVRREAQGSKFDVGKMLVPGI